MTNQIRSTHVYTNGQRLSNVVIRFSKTGIEEVAENGEAADGTLPEYPVITPAFVDPHCHMGLCRAGEPYQEDEVNDGMESILPLVDVLDSIQMDDASFRESVENGVLYSCILPGSGNIIGGRAAIVRNYETSTGKAFIGYAGIKAAAGYNTIVTRDWKGKRPYTRMGAMALLREAFYGVLEKIEKKAAAEKPSEVVFSRQEAVLEEVLRGRERLRFHVHKIDDVEAILRLVEAFTIPEKGFGPVVTLEHTGDIHEAGIFRRVKERNIPVVYGPIDSLAYKVELKHADWRNIRFLLESGVDFGLMTDHPVVLQCLLLYQTRHFLRFGLSKAEVLDIITRKNAEIIGAGGYLGTIEPGKWASFLCWSGDPFHMESRILAVYAEGKRLALSQNDPR